ncbi:hypothetical protein HG531_005534 [Fusarium graminearum]|nr:hypothetical protein HG531_005534 [Fusarium graminearum]
MSDTITTTRHKLRESSNPLSNLIAQRSNLLDTGSITQKLQKVLDGTWVLSSLSLSRSTRILINRQSDLHAAVHNIGHALKVLAVEAPRRHGGRSQTETARLQRRAVTRHGVLVTRYANEFKHALHTRAVDTLGLEVHENEVVVGAARDKRVAEVSELVGHGLGVCEDLFLVVLELRCLGLLEGDSEGGDGVVVRTALVAGEDGRVDGALEVVHDLLALLVCASHALAVEDHGAARSAQGLVGGGRDDVRVIKGCSDNTSSDKTGNVSHIREKVSTSLIGNGAHALIIDKAGIGRCSCYNDLGAVQQGVLAQLFVVDQASLLVESVGEGLVVL